MRQRDDARPVGKVNNPSMDIFRLAISSQNTRILALIAPFLSLLLISSHSNHLYRLKSNYHKQISFFKTLNTTTRATVDKTRSPSWLKIVCTKVLEHFDYFIYYKALNANLRLKICFKEFFKHNWVLYTLLNTTMTFTFHRKNGVPLLERRRCTNQRSTSSSPLEAR